MKTLLNKKTFWMSLASTMIVILFILMAVGSTPSTAFDFLPEIHRKPLGQGKYEETHTYTDAYCEEREKNYKLVGSYDAHMRWHGLLRVEMYEKNHDVEERLVYTEEVIMVHGKRDGICTITHSDGSITTREYKMGHQVTEEKGELKSTGTVSAFNMLNDHYFWQKAMLNASGYDDDYLEAFLDTFEILVDGFDFETNELDSIYGEVQDLLEETGYDSLITLNTNYFSWINGLERVKDAEFRMAVIDQYILDENGLYEVIRNTYPGYLALLMEKDVDETDFERFGLVFDSCMRSYGPLDKADPHFIDSVDTRIYRALSEIYASGQTKSTLKSALESYFGPGHLTSRLKSPLKINSTPSEVAEEVLYDLLGRFVEGDLLRQSVRRSWSVNHGVVLLPDVTTGLQGTVSATSVTLAGQVIDDGGAPVTSRGIAWAEHYDPTVEDQTEPSGTGKGAFTVVVDGLTEGNSYYARTYATNAAGTSYGNCLPFTVTNSTGPRVKQLPGATMQIYPNPASEYTYISLPESHFQRAELFIVNLNGGVVSRFDPVRLPGDRNIWKLDLSELNGGTYVCQFREKGMTIASGRLVIIK